MTAATPTADAELLEARQGAVTVLTLHRPAQRNAITPGLRQALDTALRAADADPGCRAIVLTGTGAAFCAGADTRLLGGDTDKVIASVRTTGHMPMLAPTLRTPVIAAVNGPAVGLGLVYALACDVRIAAENATFHSLFAQLGLVAEYGLGWLLQRQVGLSRATEILLTGRSVSAAEALRIGLVHQVVPQADVVAAATRFAAGLATASSPHAMAAIKEQLWADAARPAAEAVSDSIDRMIQSFATGDLAEALAARAARRAPSFRPLPGPGAGPA